MSMAALGVGLAITSLSLVCVFEHPLPRNAQKRTKKKKQGKKNRLVGEWVFDFSGSAFKIDPAPPQRTPSVCRSMLGSPPQISGSFW
jgi:hypothetical protein